MGFNSSHSGHIDTRIGAGSIARNEFGSLTVVAVQNAAVRRLRPFHSEALSGDADALRFVDDLGGLVDPDVRRMGHAEVGPAAAVASAGFCNDCGAHR